MTEAVVLAVLVKRDVAVSTPFGENHRYDFVLELDGQFYRLQCKTARYQQDKLRFQANSTSPSNTGQTKANYEGDVDYFVTHCREVGETYMVPIDAVERPRRHSGSTGPTAIRRRESIWLQTTS